MGLKNEITPHKQKETKTSKKIKPNGIHDSIIPTTESQQQQSNWGQKDGGGQNKENHSQEKNIKHRSN